MNGLRDLVNLSSDPALAISGKLRVLAVNHAAQVLFDVRSRDIIDQPCADVLRAELESGEPLCGPKCPGCACFVSRRPFSVPVCIAGHDNGQRVRMRLSTMIVPAGARVDDSDRTRAFIFMQPEETEGCNSAEKLPLRVHLLGRFFVSVNGRSIPVKRWTRKASVTALKLLALNLGIGVRRSCLIDALWPGTDEGCGRERLKVAIYYLRCQLGAPALVDFSEDAYHLDANAAWIDAIDYQGLIADGMAYQRLGRHDEAISCFVDAITLYRGDLLEENPFDEWCSGERLRLREIYFDVAERLASELIAQRRFEEAVDICHAAISREACRETFHRLVMECLVAMDRPAEAEHQYRLCREALARDLSVAPLPKTQRIYDRLRKQRRTAT